jgi:hypothetical protein
MEPVSGELHALWLLWAAAVGRFRDEQQQSCMESTRFHLGSAQISMKLAAGRVSGRWL